MNIIEQIKALSDAGKDGDTIVFVSFGVGDTTSDEFEVATLKALAESHERLLKTSQVLRDSFYRNVEATGATPPMEVKAFYAAIEQAEKL